MGGETTPHFLLPTHLDPTKNHDHYSETVKEKLLSFQDMWKSYFNSTWISFKENPHRIDSIQYAWNQLAKARKKETGSGFYLTQEEYQKCQH